MKICMQTSLTIGLQTIHPPLSHLMELTIPYNFPDPLTNAHARKSTKRNYQIVLSNLEHKGHNTSLVTIKIGALGHSLTTTHQSLQNLLPTISRRATRAMFDDAAKIAIAASHTIFLTTKSPFMTVFSYWLSCTVSYIFCPCIYFGTL